MSGYYKEQAARLRAAGFPASPAQREKPPSGNVGGVKGINLSVSNQAHYTKSTQESQGVSAKILCFKDIESKDVDWLWFPYIPRGKITLLNGDPSLGKTYFSTRLCGIVSSGSPFPDGKPCEAGNVVYLTAEDGLNDTLRPRFDEAGADVSRVFTIDESGAESLTLDDGRLRETLQTLKPALLVVDPLQAYFGAGTDAHRANETRPVLHRLGLLAEEFNTAVLLVGHLNKAAGLKAAYRLNGSIDFLAAARSALLVGKVPNTETRAVFHQKSSLATAGQTILYGFNEYGFVWSGFDAELQANDILNESAASRGRPSDASDEAAELIIDTLNANGGEMLSDDLWELCKAEGVSMATYHRARKSAGVASFQKGRQWFVRLSKIQGEQKAVAVIPQNDKPAQTPVETDFDGFERII
jgi:hypothetical protein